MVELNNAACRVCNSSVQMFLSLGKMPLANAFLNKQQLGKPEGSYPLDVGFCQRCGLVQLMQAVSPSKMFTSYVYLSSTSMTLRLHFEKLAKKISGKAKKGSLIVEIGSNDGTLLKNFDCSKYSVLGIEPSSNIAKIANNEGIKTLNMFFNEETARQIAKDYGKADVIAGTNVFAHIPDLHGLMKSLKLLIKPEGFMVFEAPYLLDMISKKEFDTIYHEHVYYLSIKPLALLFKMHGMELFDAERISIHGGSIRFYARLKSKKKATKMVNYLLDLEKRKGLHRMRAYSKFAKDAAELKEELMLLLLKLKRQGKKICGFGAPAKGNTLLNYIGADKKILDYIVDNNPYKQNLFAPGTKIPVLHPSKLLDDRPDYLLILAWNLAAEIMQEQKEFAEKGGKFIIPIPKPRII